VLGRIGIVIGLGLAVAGCAGLGGSPSAERPGTQIAVKSPDGAKWQAVGPRRQGGPSVWVCRPIACTDNAVITAQTIPSPTRDPDAKTLETAAKLLAAQTRAQDIMLEAASDGETRLTSLSNRVTQLRGYPAVVAELKGVANKKTRYLVRADVFVGLFLVKVMSVSDSREEANRNLEALMAAMEIIDVRPGAPAAAEAPAAAALGANGPSGSGPVVGE
jgi:hypothetical protein